MLKQIINRIKTQDVWAALQQSLERVKDSFASREDDRFLNRDYDRNPFVKIWAVVRRPFCRDDMPHQPRYMWAALLGVTLLAVCGLMVGGIAAKDPSRGGTFAALKGVFGTPTPEPLPYSIQVGSPKYAQAFSHAEQGCQWVGVAGQVFDESGEGVSGLAVLVSGSINDRPFEQIVFTEKEGVYGPGSYELFLADRLPDGPTSFEIRLLDLQFNALSDPQIVRVPAQCNKNLVLVNFQGAYDTQMLYFPSVAH